MSVRALTLRKAAERLGVHHTTLRRWIEDGTGPRALVLPGTLRRTIRIMPGDLDRFIDQNSRGRIPGGERVV